MIKEIILFLGRAFSIWLIAVVTIVAVGFDGKAYATETSNIVELTIEEKSWIAKHPTITLSTPTGAPPKFYLDEQGKLVGINIDYMRFLGDRIGVKIEFKLHSSWSNALNDALQHRVDGIPGADKTEDRQRYLNFTDIYATYPQTLVTKVNDDKINSFDDLGGKRVAVKKSSSRVSILRENYPDAQIVEVDNYETGFKMLASSEVDVIFAGLAEIYNFISEKFYVTFRFADIADIPGVGHVRIGLKNDDQILLQIFNKAIASLTKADHFAIRKKWLPKTNTISSKEQKFKLTSREQNWLDEHQVIRVGANSAWGPIEFLDSDENYKGLSIDYLKKIESLLGIKFEIVRENGQNLIGLAKKQELDLFSCVASTPEREQFLLFTEPYIQMPAGIFAQKEVAYIIDLKKIAGEKIAVVEGSVIHDHLKSNHPNFVLVLVKTPEEGIRKVLQKKAFAYIDNIITTDHIISRKGYLDIKMVGEIPFIFAQSMGIRKDWPQLRDILQKALSTIPDSDRNAIYNKWVPLTYEKRLDYKLLWKISAGCLILICLIFFWNRKLAAEVNKRTSEYKESENRFRSAFDYAGIGIGLISLGGHWLKVNQALCKIMGYAKEEMEKLTLQDITYPDDLEADLSHVRALIDGKANSYEMEKRYVHKDGRIIWIQLNTSILKGENKQPLYFISQIQDITGRKQAEEALKEKTKFLDHIIESSALSMWISDEKGTAIRTNPACLEFFGATEEEIVGKYNLFKDVVIEKQGFMPVVRDIFEKGKPASFVIDYDFGEVDHVDVKNATHKITKTVLTPVLDNNKKVSNVIVQAIDLTEIKKAEEENIKVNKSLAEHEKLSLVGQIAGKMAHDFNNILGIIMGNAELALIDCPDDQTKKKLDLIYHQTIRGKNLTKNLVAFAKGQEPKQKFFSIDEKMDLVLNLLKKDLEGIHVIRRYSYGIPPVLADSGMIEHAIVNLIQNSIHALSLIEQPEIKIHTYHQGELIFIEIEDNGCGIPPEFIGEIYKPSFTLKGIKDNAGMYKPGIKGTGYGMSNVKKYIEQHKGNISIHSELQKGTKITITLPVIKKELTDEEIKEIKKENFSFEKYILLVEDEKDISDVQYNILTHEPCNHKVDIANNGQVALDLLNRNEYDLISLDYFLPGKHNGMDVYHHIREINTAVPVLFISGNIEFLESIKDLKQKDPYVDHLSKPCKSKDYVNCVNTLLKYVAI